MWQENDKGYPSNNTTLFPHGQYLGRPGGVWLQLTLIGTFLNYPQEISAMALKFADAIYWHNCWKPRNIILLSSQDPGREAGRKESNSAGKKKCKLMDSGGKNLRHKGLEPG